MRALPRILILLLLITPFHSRGSQRTDSLINAYRSAKNDTVKIWTLLNIADEVCSTNTDSAKNTWMLALQIANKALKHDTAYPVNEHYTKRLLNLKANALGGVGYILYITNDPAKGMQDEIEALKIFEQVNDKADLAQSYNNVGYMYTEKGDLYTSLIYYEKGLALRKALKDTDGVATCMNNIGYAYQQLNDTAKALQYFTESLTLRVKIQDKKGIATCLNNIATIYSHGGQTDKAIASYNKLLDYVRKFDNKPKIALVMDNLATCYERKGDIDSAFYCARYALSAYKELNDKEGVAYAESNLGKFFFNKNQLDSARKYTVSAFTAAKELGYKSLIADVAYNYSKLSQITGDYKNAYDMYLLYKQMTDSINTKKAEKEAIATQLKYDYEKKEIEQKEQQRQEQLAHDEELKRQHIIIWSVSGGFVLLVIFMLILATRFRIIREQKTVIEKQKMLVEEKNKDLTDSIHYASRIQKALLTTHDYLGKHLNEYFIFFKPRDIVSGDFYWAFAGNNDNFFLACCDCTGHGVPGAFMSLLNISMLNESVIEHKITRPDLVLNDVRHNLIKALNPEGSDTESKDGMDCVLCSFDMKKGTLNLACANNPVWIIPSAAGVNGVVEITPDKMPVGVQYGEQKPFTLKTAPIEKGDCIYLFTDGYADQFGGAKGKKFKYKQLQELIVANANKPMAEQRRILSETFEEWKGDLEQVDDVLIIGIRV